MMRRMLSALVLGLFGLPPALAQTAEEAPRPVVSEIVESEAGLARSWVGSVAAEQEIALGFLVLGTLAQRGADAGDVVAKGDVLARLESSDLEAGLRAAEAGVAIAEAGYDTARDAAERAKQLLARGVGSQASTEAAENTLAAADAQLRQARAALAQARDARSYADLGAPADGVITEVFAEPGATLEAGEPVLQLAVDDAREVLISMTQDDAAAMSAGAQFDIRLVSNRAVAGAATLTRIDPISERTSRTRLAHLTVSDDTPVDFRLGALVSATLTAESGRVITLPVAALIAGAEPPAVWVIAGDGRRLRRAEVATGPAAGGRLVVLSGLAEGDEVLVRGVNSVQEGQAVGPRTGPEAIR